MEISKNSLNEIKKLLESYDEKKYDMEVYHNIIEILRCDKLFDNQILVGKGNGSSPTYIIAREEKLYFSEDVIPYSEEYHKCICLPFVSELDSYKYKFILTLFHELVHLKQCDYALHSKNKFEIINELYKKVLFNRKLNQKHYIKQPFDYVFEYNAHLEAYNVLLYLFNDNPILTLLNNLEYLSLVCNHYYDYKKGEITFLSEKTYKLLKIKDVNNIQKCYDLPLEVLINNGLPINKDKFNDLFGNESDSQDDYMRKILDIRKK